MFTSPVFQTILDYFDVTQPKIKVEPIPETFGPYGAAYRLTDEASGEVRNVLVLRDWEQDEKTGEDIVVRDLKSLATRYVSVEIIPPSQRELGRSREARMKTIEDKPLLFEDHDALVDFFEKGREERAKSDPPIQLKIVRRYPPKPEGTMAVSLCARRAKKTLELN